MKSGGVRTGRGGWGQTASCSYWTFISLGAVLGGRFGGFAFGLGDRRLFQGSSVSGRDADRALHLCFAASGIWHDHPSPHGLYMYFPNAAVKGETGTFIGALLVAALLFLNNYLSILYVGQVIRFQSLYGSVGIIPVLMMGCSFFWVLYSAWWAESVTQFRTWTSSSHREAWASGECPRSRDAHARVCFAFAAT